VILGHKKMIAARRVLKVSSVLVYLAAFGLERVGTNPMALKVMPTLAKRADDEFVVKGTTPAPEIGGE
jgi:hypothetical protein